MASARKSYIDPYISSYTGDKAANWSDMAPLVAGKAPPKDSVLQIYVPAENTTVDYGAGKIPGIRMATDHHVHLTAVSPLTTISLGAPAGLGVSGGAGLNVFSAAAKSEEIMTQVNERYHGSWSSWCGSTRGEHVVGSWSQVCENTMSQACKNFSMFVQETSQYRYIGNSTVTYDQNCVTTIGGQTENHYQSPKFDWHYGVTFAFFAGASVSVNCGVTDSTFVGLSNSLNMSGAVSKTVGASMSVKIGVDVGLSLSASISRSLYSDSKTLFTAKDGGITTDKSITSIKNEVTGIVSSVMKVFK